MSTPTFLQRGAHWVGLLAISLFSLGSTFLLMRAQDELPQRLATLRQPKVAFKEVSTLDLSSFEQASNSLKSPQLWGSEAQNLLFVSERYILVDGQAVKPKEASIFSHSKTREPIPNSWFIHYKLNFNSPRVPFDDPDDDGFTNEEEWLAHTDPTDPKSHPPLVTKLYFSQLNVTNHRLRFLHYTGNKDKPDTVRVMVRLEDEPKTPKHELKLGDLIPGTDIALEKFESRTKPGLSVDASVVTFVQKSTGRRESAEIREFANYADKTLSLRLFYPKEDKSFALKLGSKLTLSEGEIYDIIDANESAARLRSATGMEYEIRALPQSQN